VTTTVCKWIVAAGLVMSLTPTGIRFWAEHQRRVRMEAWDADIARIRSTPRPRGRPRLVEAIRYRRDDERPRDPFAQ